MDRARRNDLVAEMAGIVLKPAIASVGALPLLFQISDYVFESLLSKLRYFDLVNLIHMGCTSLNRKIFQRCTSLQLDAIPSNVALLMTMINEMVNLRQIVTRNSSYMSPSMASLILPLVVDNVSLIDCQDRPPSKLAKLTLPVACTSINFGDLVNLEELQLLQIIPNLRNTLPVGLGSLTITSPVILPILVNLISQHCPYIHQLRVENQFNELISLNDTISSKPIESMRSLQLVWKREMSQSDVNWLNGAFPKVTHLILTAEWPNKIWPSTKSNFAQPEIDYAVFNPEETIDLSCFTHVVDLHVSSRGVTFPPNVTKLSMEGFGPISGSFPPQLKSLHVLQCTNPNMEMPVKDFKMHDLFALMPASCITIVNHYSGLSSQSDLQYYCHEARRMKSKEVNQPGEWICFCQSSICCPNVELTDVQTIDECAKQVEQYECFRTPVLEWSPRLTITMPDAYRLSKLAEMASQDGLVQIQQWIFRWLTSKELQSLDPQSPYYKDSISHLLSSRRYCHWLPVTHCWLTPIMMQSKKIGKSKFGTLAPVLAQFFAKFFTPIFLGLESNAADKSSSCLEKSSSMQFNVALGVLLLKSKWFRPDYPKISDEEVPDLELFDAMLEIFDIEYPLHMLNKLKHQLLSIPNKLANSMVLALKATVSNFKLQQIMRIIRKFWDGEFSDAEAITYMNQLRYIE